eukprot:3135966-Rhodomonas_salina.1
MSGADCGTGPGLRVCFPIMMCCVLSVGRARCCVSWTLAALRTASDTQDGSQVVAVFAVCCLVLTSSAMPPM